MNINIGKAFALAIIAAAIFTPAFAEVAIDVEKAMADRAIGKDDAPITIIEYASLTCDHCAAFHNNALPEVKKQLIDTGKARLIFRDMPWDQYALKAGKMARCAPAEKYFDILETLYKTQANWARSADPARGIADIGIAAGMDEAYIKACFDSDALDTAMAVKVQEGRQKFDVNATPAFVFMKGDERLTEFPEFQEIFDRLGKHDHAAHPH